MGSAEEKPAPKALFEEIDGPYLVGMGNWLAESLDVSELKNEQVLLLYMALDRGLKALWKAFPEVFKTISQRLLAELMDDDDDDDDDDDGDDE